MRNIEVTAKTVDQAVEKGLQMLGVNKDDIEVKVISEGSMLKKAVVEIYTFASPEEREEYKKNNANKKEIKLVKTEEDQIVEVSSEGVEDVTKLVVPFLEGVLAHMNIEGTVTRGVRNGDIVFKINGDGINNLIGYHGETLEAIQYIVNTIVRNACRNNPWSPFRRFDDKYMNIRLVDSERDVKEHDSDLFVIGSD